MINRFDMGFGDEPRTSAKDGEFMLSKDVLKAMEPVDLGMARIGIKPGYILIKDPNYKKEL